MTLPSQIKRLISLELTMMAISGLLTKTTMSSNISGNKSVLSIVAGTFGASGYFDGNVVKSLLNKPSGLYIWKSSSHNKIRAQNTKPALSSAAGENTFACKFATKDNYTLCGDEIIASSRTNNDGLTSNQKETIPNDGIVNAKNVQMISNFQHETLYFTLPSQLTGTDVIGTTYVYVADTESHCIRRISLSSSHVDTVAGICGTSGFKDGPLDTNLFNSPELVSLNAEGNIFVFDDGNNYVRMMDLTGIVYTLYQGACDLAYNEYPPEIPFDLKLKTLICYKDWKKVYGKPDGHYYSSATT
ncbi:unnamed protein product [Moneuplotes crassus]|uniref:Uncharacterized protein n=1 Tax=Euplotes crassus TaxID=5936 RepID=A0AAD1UUV9_EUPCR|nr:unnamed protein product [Moneuplotes crassus]